MRNVGACETGARTRASLAREGVGEERARAVREQKGVEGEREREEGSRRERTRERID
jgi:hypothetical protein